MVKLIVGAPPTTGSNDQDNVGIVTWNPVLYVAGPTPNAALEFIHMVAQHKVRSGAITMCLQIRTSKPQCHGRSDPMPSPFLALPPRGRRHVLCQLERQAPEKQEEDSDEEREGQQGVRYIFSVLCLAASICLPEPIRGTFHPRSSSSGQPQHTGVCSDGGVFGAWGRQIFFDWYFCRTVCSTSQSSSSTWLALKMRLGFGRNTNHLDFYKIFSITNSFILHGASNHYMINCHNFLHLQVAQWHLGHSFVFAGETVNWKPRCPLYSIYTALADLGKQYVGVIWSGLSLLPVEGALLQVLHGLCLIDRWVNLNIWSQSSIWAETVWPLFCKRFYGAEAEWPSGLLPLPCQDVSPSRPWPFKAFKVARWCKAETISQQLSCPQKSSKKQAAGKVNNPMPACELRNQKRHVSDYAPVLTGFKSFWKRDRNTPWTEYILESGPTHSEDL